ncbi:hypothetical protein CWC19_00730 [Pseudoalteromonas aurantia]|uniref:Uncharacterized protein n=1 Tax=Pseudoalteromonas aurantia TaxID=43654 RepID=A0A5S3VE56_9GAMM|nr:hypothetical protein CWC19_00730 [Pseudoalteromonas aurantia]
MSNYCFKSSLLSFKNVKKKRHNRAILACEYLQPSTRTNGCTYANLYIENQSTDSYCQTVTGRGVYLVLNLMESAGIELVEDHIIYK